MSVYGYLVVMVTYFEVKEEVHPTYLSSHDMHNVATFIVKNVSNVAKSFVVEEQL